MLATFSGKPPKLSQAKQNNKPLMTGVNKNKDDL